MPTNDYEVFKGTSHYGSDGYVNALESNLKHHFDWAFLKIGAWQDVDVPTSGVYGGTFHTLRPTFEVGYTSGQVWEGPRKDWVFETGVDYTGTAGATHNPNTPTIYVDSSGISVSTSGYEHHINYPLGRVVFDTAISTGTSLTASYAYRNVQVYRADDAPWLMELQQDSLRPDITNRNDLDDDPSAFSLNAHQHVQMPAIVIDAISTRNTDPYELGNKSMWTRQDVTFHVLAESKFERNNIMDILAKQEGHALRLYSAYDVSASGDFPLDYRGMVVDNPKMYPEIVNDTDYFWKKCWVTDAALAEMMSLTPYLHRGIVRLTFEAII